jgi:hypothetical protein
MEPLVCAQAALERHRPRAYRGGRPSHGEEEGETLPPWAMVAVLAFLDRLAVVRFCLVQPGAWRYVLLVQEGGYTGPHAVDVCLRHGAPAALRKTMDAQVSELVARRGDFLLHIVRESCLVVVLSLLVC